MYGASKNVSSVHLGLICCNRNSVLRSVCCFFGGKIEENGQLGYKMSLQNLCPEPNLRHIDEEIKNYKILKDRGAETKVTPLSTVTSF